MKKVLVVDDDEDILLVVKILLERYGFLVEAVSKGGTIDENIKKFEPGLILLDINLPDVDGRAVCKELKSKDASKDIPVVLFSAAYNLKDSYHECKADGFIEKPFDPKNFINMANEFFKA
ncbi:MAG: hypothetical protein NVSMB45_16350 [Ginsengibacter sp.]